jgi:hypothetical protein
MNLRNVSLALAKVSAERSSSSKEMAFWILGITFDIKYLMLKEKWFGIRADRDE